MEVIAITRNARMSAAKGRPLARECRGLPVSAALKVVEFSPKKAAVILKKTLLSPLMIVAGDHANNDMADKDDPESWYSILKKEGFAVETMIKGLGEDAGIAAAFVEHLKAALK